MLAVIVHPTANKAGPTAPPDYVGPVRVLHDRAMKVALRGLLKAPDRDRKALTFAYSALLESPRDSLVQRFLDLAPARDRAILREQLL